MFNEELCGYVTEVTMLLREGPFLSKMLDQISVQNFGRK
jgi:hypothetical protein